MTPKVVLGTVHPDFVDAQFMHAMVTTLTEDYGNYLPARARVMMSRAPAGMIHIARNAVVQGFLNHPLKVPYLVFIDSDIAWTPDQVWRLVDSAVEHDLPALSGLVSFEMASDTESEIIPML